MHSAFPGVTVHVHVFLIEFSKQLINIKLRFELV